MRDPHRGVPHLVQERENLSGFESAALPHFLGHRLSRRLAVELFRGLPNDRLEAWQLPSQHPQARRLDLSRALVVVPEVPQRARVRCRPSEPRAGLPEQRIRLVECRFGLEAGQLEGLRVPRVRGPERLDRRDRRAVSKFGLDRVKDRREAAACKLNQRPHPRRRPPTELDATRIERLPSTEGDAADVIRADAFLHHVSEERLDERLGQVARLAELEARPEGRQELAFRRVVRGLADARHLRDDLSHRGRCRDEEPARALVCPLDERLVGPKFLPEVEHRALRRALRFKHAAAECMEAH